MRVYAAFLLVFFVTLFSVSAQEQAPRSEAPTVSLPDMESEAQAVVPAIPAAPLPPLSELPEPAVPPELESPGSLRLPDSAWRSEVAENQETATSGESTFTEAQIGAGAFGEVNAALSISRPGVEPSFRLNFSHDSIDGFAFHERGQGFFRRNTNISARMRSSFGQRHSLLVLASYMDANTGMQGQSTDFYGLSHRFITLGTEYALPLGPLQLRTGLDAVMSERSPEIVSAASPVGVLAFQEYLIHPSLNLSWTYKDTESAFIAEYWLQALGGLEDTQIPLGRIAHLLQTRLGFNWETNGAFAMSAKAGYAWSSSLGHLPPFDIAMELGLGEFGLLGIRGGLAVEPQTLGDLWKEIPWLDAAPIAADNGRWNASLQLGTFPVGGFSAKLKGLWALSLDKSGRIVPQSPSVGDSRNLYSWTVLPYHLLDTEFGLSWSTEQMGPGVFTLSASWKAAWMDASVLGEQHFLAGMLEYREKEGVWGTSMKIDVAAKDQSFLLPLLDADVFVRLSSGLRLSAQARDILCAFSGQNGRIRYTPYLETGFRATLNLQLSL
jgi:hypothetical protein